MHYQHFGITATNDPAYLGRIRLVEMRSHFAVQLVLMEMVKQMGEISIAPKELLPILLASATWGKGWRGEIVLFRCDNQTVVSALAKSSSRDKIVMQLLRVLQFVADCYSFTCVSTHIPCVSNVAEDALSRDSMPNNQCLSLQLNEQPAAIPLQFLELLLSPHLD